MPESNENFPRTIGRNILTVKANDGTIIERLSSNPIAAVLETRDMDFDARQAMKYVDVVLAEIADVKELNSIAVDIGWRDSLSDEINWLPVAEQMTQEDFHFFIRLTARYFRFRIFSDSPGVFWRLSALEIFGRAHGRRF